MGIKKYNAYTPSRRHMTGSDFKEITKDTPEKSLVVSLNKNAGRNNQGKITVRHRGGGSRRKYRIIDFKRNSKDGIPATVIELSTIQTELPTSLLSAMQTARRHISLAPQGLNRRNEGYERRYSRGKAWQLHATVSHPGWYSGTQH